MGVLVHVLIQLFLKLPCEKVMAKATRVNVKVCRKEKSDKTLCNQLPQINCSTGFHVVQQLPGAHLKSLCKEIDAMVGRV
jgi:hypothetical protein